MAHTKQRPTAVNVATALAIAADIVSRHRECERQQMKNLNAAAETVIAASPHAVEASTAQRSATIGAFNKNPNKVSTLTVQCKWPA